MTSPASGPQGWAAEGWLASLERRADHWDRPDGDWGEGVPEDDLTLEVRSHANSCYQLGSRALARGNRHPAEGWLAAAMKAGHPGAWFRVAALVCRSGSEVFGGDGADAYLRYLVGGAADRGHGDAQRLVLLLADRAADPLPSASWEDPDYGPEILSGLQCGLVLTRDRPAQTDLKRARRTL
ncbi:hypothetical protein ACFV0B_26875 [Streptomyces xanthophaeus]|uniref:hypothetical protein n=1 Tax=Streptomyces xanthophaeus TaxID=67385 RepID=UPI003685ED63